MSRQRKGVRPLSQTGFHHLPRNPRQRNFPEGGGKAKNTVLAAFNEGEDTRQLHPTKGWRELSVKRSRAQMLMAEMQNGQGRPLHLQSRFITEGY